MFPTVSELAISELGNALEAVERITYRAQSLLSESRTEAHAKLAEEIQALRMSFEDGCIDIIEKLERLGYAERQAV